jgi:hypothetical protein
VTWLLKICIQHFLLLWPILSPINIVLTRIFVPYATGQRSGQSTPMLPRLAPRRQSVINHTLSSFLSTDNPCCNMRTSIPSIQSIIGNLPHCSETHTYYAQVAPCRVPLHAGFGSPTASETDVTSKHPNKLHDTTRNGAYKAGKAG